MAVIHFSYEAKKVILQLSHRFDFSDFRLVVKLERRQLQIGPARKFVTLVPKKCLACKTY